jgi:hypothetical protein
MEVKRNETDDRHGSEPAVQLPASASDASLHSGQSWGGTHGETYVVCLDCAKQFAYDLTTMRIGKPIDHSHEAFVVHPAMPHPHKTRLKYALVGAGVPLALLLGSKLVGRILKREKKS